jgi:hypothetical protein
MRDIPGWMPGHRRLEFVGVESSIMKVRAGILLLGCALLCGALIAHAAEADRHVSVWIISPEGSGPNDIAQGEDIPSRACRSQEPAFGC